MREDYTSQRPSKEARSREKNPPRLIGGLNTSPRGTCGLAMHRCPAGICFANTAVPPPLKIGFNSPGIQELRGCFQRFGKDEILSMERRNKNPRNVWFLQVTIPLINHTHFFFSISFRPFSHMVSSHHPLTLLISISQNNIPWPGTRL